MIHPRQSLSSISSVGLLLPISMHKMSLREEVRRCNKTVEETENELRRQQEALLLASHHHSNVEQDFTKTLDSFVGRIRSFDKTVSTMLNVAYNDYLLLGQHC